MIESTVNSLLDINLEIQNNGLYSITVGVLHSPIGLRMVKEMNGQLPKMPTENLTYAEAQIFGQQWQNWIDKQNKDKAQWKKKKKKGGRK